MLVEHRMATSRELDHWFGQLDHPLKDVMLRVREIVLGVDDRIEEAIKWKSPTFMFEGNIASIDPKAKAHVTLLFHQGAKIPGKHPRLQGGGNIARYMRFADLKDVAKQRKALEAAILGWIRLKSKE